MKDEFSLLVDGRTVAGATTMQVVNPATEEVAATCPRASREQVEDAVCAARDAQPDWGRTPLASRQAALADIATIIETNLGELAQLITVEQGKPISLAQFEVAGAAAFFRHVSILRLDPKVIEDSEERRVELHRRPLGVVAAIIPWNFPLLLMAFKIPAALLAGNTVVLKPAPTTPLATLRLAELVRDAVPPGVLNVVTDANDLGDVLTEHPDVAKISFTGSTETGRRVAARAAGGLKRVTLELGGNDPAIVLDDVDVKIAAAGIFKGAFMNSGQACIAIKRLYVHESVHDALCDELAALVRDARLGDGLDAETTIGPLQNRRQYEKVQALLDNARSTGRILVGGQVPDRPGYFIEPTLVADATEGSAIVDEEQFGPVLPILRYSDVEDAVTGANASAYGLGASLWSSDHQRALDLADRLEAGTVWINQHIDLAPHIPQAGAKASGVGIEIGEEGLLEFTQPQIVNRRLHP